MNFDEPQSAAIKFKSKTDGQYTASLFQVNSGDTNTGIACSHHFVVRKDFLLNGMINCLEGAIILHAGKYRKWGGTQPDQPTQPTIFSGGDLLDQTGYNVIEFRRMDTNAFIPIRCTSNA